MPDVVVIGGGITGTAAADALAREGHAVTLIEAKRIAAMASGWSLGGVRQSGRDPVELPLARAAVAIWAELTDTLGADVEYRRNGNLRLARTPAEVDVLRALVASQRAQGLDLDLLENAADVRAIAPALSPSVLAASFCPTDGHANPVKATQAFADSARRHGATIRENVAARAIRVVRDRVTGVETDTGVLPADRVIVAAGVNTPELLATARPRSAVVGRDRDRRAKRARRAVPRSGLRRRQRRLRRPAGSRWPAALHRRLDSMGDAIASRWTTRFARAIGERRRGMCRSSSRSVLPIAGRAPIARTWGGLIDLTPDALPVIDAPAVGRRSRRRRGVFGARLLPRAGQRLAVRRPRAGAPAASRSFRVPSGALQGQGDRGSGADAARLTLCLPAGHNRVNS